MEGLGLIHVASLERQSLVLKDCYRSAHAFEPELPVERLFAWHRVKDDLLVTRRHGYEFRDDLPAQTETLMSGKKRDIADVEQSVPSASALPIPTSLPSSRTKHLNILFVNAIRRLSGFLLPSGAAW